MNLGALEVQIFVSLALVLGAILVALVCDFLKGNNEALREKNIELRVRQEERERLREMIPALSQAQVRTVQQEAPARAPAPVATPVVAEETPRTPSRQPAQTPAWAHLEELDEADRIASRIRSRLEEDEVEETVREIEQQGDDDVEAVGELESEDEQADLISALHAKVTPIDRLALERASAEAALRLAEELARAAQTTSDEIEDFSEQKEEVSGSPAEDEAVEQSAEVETTAPGSGHDSDAGTPVAEDVEDVPSLPGGMLAQEEFAELVDSIERFEGAVVAVGINGKNGATQDARQAAMLMESLLGPNGLGCKIAEDEYVLVFPGETGAAGQRRFQQVSQRLWDHQIRSVASSSTTFSWGAMETTRATLAATVASARERLEQTRRHREHAPSQVQNFRLIKG